MSKKVVSVVEMETIVSSPETDDHEILAIPTMTTVTSPVVVIATKKCAKHGEYFPSESNIRELGEFYGDAKSSYCRRCMLHHHQIRRQNLKMSENREKSLYEEFTRKVRILAEKGIAFNDVEDESGDFETVESVTDEFRKLYTRLVEDSRK